MPARDFQIVFQADTTQAIASIQALNSEFIALTNNINGVRQAMLYTTPAAVSLNNAMTNLNSTLATTSTVTRTNHADFMAMTLAWVGVQVAIHSLIEFGEIANKSRDRIKDLAIETMGLRDKMRELANLENKSGPDNTIAGEVIALGVEAAMQPEKAIKFLEQFKGSVATGAQKQHIDKWTEEDFGKEAAKFGQRIGLNPATSGDLAGSIPSHIDLMHSRNGNKVPHNVAVERGMTEYGRIAYGLNEGRGNLQPLAHAMLNSMGSNVGKGKAVPDMGDYSAIFGVATTHNAPKHSGTQIDRAIAALDDEQGPAGKFNRTFGNFAGVKIDFLSRIKRIRAMADEAKEKKGIDTKTFLKTKGFGHNNAQLEALTEQVEDYHIIKERIDKGRATIQGKIEMRKNTEFIDSDRAGAKAKTEANKAAHEFVIGGKHEQVEIAKDRAEQRAKKAGTMGGTGNDYMFWLGDLMGAKTMLGFQSSKENFKEVEAEKELYKEALRVGIPKEHARNLLGHHRMKTLHGSHGEWHQDVYQDVRTEKERRTGWNALAQQVERKGGNVYGSLPDNRPEIKHMINEQKTTNKLLLNMQPNGPAAKNMPNVRANAVPKRGGP